MAATMPTLPLMAGREWATESSRKRAGPGASRPGDFRTRPGPV